MSRLDSLVFLWHRRVYVVAPEPLLSDGFQSNPVVMSFRVAALHFVIFSRVYKSVERRFVWQKQYFCAVVTRWVAFFVASAALSRCAVACFCKSHCQGCVKWWQRANRVAGVASCDMTPHLTLYIPHSTLHTLHSTVHTLHSTLYTPHFTLCIPHATLHTLHFTFHTLHSTLYTPHFTLHPLHFALHTPQSPLHTLHYIPHSTLHFLHFPHFALHPLPDSTVFSALVR